MRVSERMRYETAEHRIERSKSDNADALNRLSTQKDISKISDNPIGAAQAIKFRDRIAGSMQNQRNIDFSKGFLERAEAAVSGISDNLMRAKEIAIGMVNDTYDAHSREASSREIREIMDEVVQLGNTQFNGRFVFGGFRNQTPPLNLEGDYLGDDGGIFVQVSPGNFRQVNLQARELFEATPDEAQQGHFGLVETLDVLYQGLVNNDKTSMRKAMNELEHQMEKTTSNQASIGGMWKSLTDARGRLEKEEELSRASLSEVEDADVFKATSDFKRTEAALQSTLMASTKLLQPSLLNFLQ